MRMGRPAKSGISSAANFLSLGAAVNCRIDAAGSWVFLKTGTCTNSLRSSSSLRKSRRLNTFSIAGSAGFWVSGLDAISVLAVSSFGGGAAGAACGLATSFGSLGVSSFTSGGCSFLAGSGFTSGWEIADSTCRSTIAGRKLLSSMLGGAADLRLSAQALSPKISVMSNKVVVPRATPITRQ